MGHVCAIRSDEGLLAGVAARGIVVTLAALVIVVNVVGSAFWASYHETISDDIRSSGANALWLRHQWVGEPHSPADYDDLAELLRTNEEPFGGAASLGRRVASRYHAWTTDYFEEVASRVDQVAVMTYDSAMPTDWLYGAVVRQQTSDLAELIGDETMVLIGIPSYDESNIGHRPSAENVRSGIRGVRLGLADLAEDAPTVGIAVYTEWTMDTDEWATWRRDWLGEPAR